MSFVTVIIDMQEDFFLHDRLSNNRALLAQKTNELISVSREFGSIVVWVKQQYLADLSNAPPEIRKNNIKIVVEGTDGAEFLAELNIQHQDPVIVKTRYSAFYETDFDQLLNEMNVSAIIVAGINSHACVRTTVIDAYQRNYKIILASECIDSYDSEHHAMSMSYMSKQIGGCASIDEIRAILQNA